MTDRRHRWALAVVTCVMALLAGCSTLVPAPAAPPENRPVVGSPEAAWARVLARFVDERGEVDFPALARDRADLDRYVRYVAETPLDALSGDVKYAHMINAYNALSMFNVIESGIPQTHAGLNKVKFFILRKLPIGGQAMSLYAFENDVIRPFARARADPRVHFALNCSAVSCPVLPQRPFMPGAIDTELEREARAFFARSEKLPHRPGDANGVAELDPRVLFRGLRSGARHEPHRLRQPLRAGAGTARLHRSLHALRLDGGEQPAQRAGAIRKRQVIGAGDARRFDRRRRDRSIGR